MNEQHVCRLCHNNTDCLNEVTQYIWELDAVSTRAHPHYLILWTRMDGALLGTDKTGEQDQTLGGATKLNEHYIFRYTSLMWKLQTALSASLEMGESCSPSEERKIQRRKEEWSHLVFNVIIDVTRRRAVQTDHLHCSFAHMGDEKRASDR